MENPRDAFDSKDWTQPPLEFSGIIRSGPYANRSVHCNYLSETLEFNVSYSYDGPIGPDMLSNQLKIGEMVPSIGDFSVEGVGNTAFDIRLLGVLQVSGGSMKLVPGTSIRTEGPLVAQQVEYWRKSHQLRQLVNFKVIERTWPIVCSIWVVNFVCPTNAMWPRMVKRIHSDTIGLYADPLFGTKRMPSFNVFPSSSMSAMVLSFYRYGTHSLLVHSPQGGPPKSFSPLRIDFISDFSTGKATIDTFFDYVSSLGAAFGNYPIVMGYSLRTLEGIDLYSMFNLHCASAFRRLSTKHAWPWIRISSNNNFDEFILDQFLDRALRSENRNIVLDTQRWAIEAMTLPLEARATVMRSLIENLCREVLKSESRVYVDKEDYKEFMKSVRELLSGKDWNAQTKEALASKLHNQNEFGMMEKIRRGLQKMGVAFGEVESLAIEFANKKAHKASQASTSHSEHQLADALYVMLGKICLRMIGYSTSTEIIDYSTLEWPTRKISEPIGI